MEVIFGQPNFFEAELSGLVAGPSWEEDRRMVGSKSGKGFNVAEWVGLVPFGGDEESVLLLLLHNFYVYDAVH